MGRELKRVPMDFDAPLDKSWAGYQNPWKLETDCGHCTNGYSQAYREVEREVSSGGWKKDVRQICKERGVDTTCHHCGGRGYTYECKAHEKIEEDWEPVEPPEGPGYQMWQTVSDGPYTPVFATPEELAAYLVKEKAGLDMYVSYEQWMRMIEGEGWAPSIVITSQGMTSGVNAL